MAHGESQLQHILFGTVQLVDGTLKVLVDAVADADKLDEHTAQQIEDLVGRILIFIEYLKKLSNIYRIYQNMNGTLIIFRIEIESKVRTYTIV